MLFARIEICNTQTASMNTRIYIEEVLYGVLLLFFSSSASLIKEIRNRSIAIETLKRITLARASRTSFVQARRHRASCETFALTPRTVASVSKHRIITRNRFLNSSRAHSAFSAERWQYALDIRRNASRDRTCGRLLLRHDFYISIHKYYTTITVRGNVQPSITM